jgi:hypothetical protein
MKIARRAVSCSHFRMPPSPPTRARIPLSRIVYAKNAKHEAFIQQFDGKLKARYVISYLVSVEFVGSTPLRKLIENELGNPKYRPDDWVSAWNMVVIFQRATEMGLSSERLGETVFPAYKRSRPALFEGRSLLDGFSILEQAYRDDTTYGGVSQGRDLEPGCARLYRKGSPLPCEYFVGVLKGVLRVFGARGSVQEVACEWEGRPSCCFEVRWDTSPPVEPR